MRAGLLDGEFRILGLGHCGYSTLTRPTTIRESIVALDTDSDQLRMSPAVRQVLIGPVVAKGIGTGSNLEKGAQAVKESKESIEELLSGASVLFLVLGLGRGTGTGGGPVLAEMARRAGITTVTIALWPYSFEGPRRENFAREGIPLLLMASDLLCVVNMDRLVGRRFMADGTDDSIALADDLVVSVIQGLIANWPDTQAAMDQALLPLRWRTVADWNPTLASQMPEPDRVRPFIVVADASR